MAIIPRWYQDEATEAGVQFFKKKEKKNGILICPTGSGKSVIIAMIAAKLPGKTVVFQPSKEILQQNFAKFIAYGYRAGIYSASAGMKFIDTITFATIGSVNNKHHLFSQFNNIIIDECHLVNADSGMYRNFIKSIGHAKVLGLTATPYRLTSTFDGSMLKFITRTSPRIFNKVLYTIQNDVLFDAGYLSKLEYFNFDTVNREMLETNQSGTDFTDASLRAYYRKIDMPGKTAGMANRLLAKRKNLLVFCTLTEEARKVQRLVPGSYVVTADTPPGERDNILKMFKAGVIRCVINVGVLTTGFDYPALETILIARSTMSLAVYYQIVGRIMRPHPEKSSGWVVDMGGNVKFFGKIETMKIKTDSKGLYIVTNHVNGNTRQLTNVTFSKS